MSISFTLNEYPHLFESHWHGRVDPDSMLDSYSAFFATQKTGDRYLEFADFSQADMSEIQVPHLRALCSLISDHYTRLGVECARCASWIPREINRSMMEIYSFLSKLSPEVTAVFGSQHEAKAWLLRDENLSSEVSLHKQAC